MWSAPLADPNAHSEPEFRVYLPGTVGLLGCRVHLSDQSGQPVSAHLRRGQDAVLVFVTAGAILPEQRCRHF